MPQIVRLAATMRDLGCPTVTAVLREDLVPRLGASPPFTCVPARTPTSLHTLVRGFDAVAPGPVFCSMVDSVMADGDWSRLFAACRRSLDRGSTAVLAVTPLTTGDAALHATIDASGRVQSLGAAPGPSGRVTGGVYAFAPAARPLARRAVSEGVERMRGYLAWLLEQACPVDAVEVERIVDVDRAADVPLAETVLGATTFPARASDAPTRATDS